MITANTKLTALEVLQECGVENAESIIGTMRVRIGGIAGINTPDHLIFITPDTKVVEVIVGGDIYDLELSKGNAENNTDIKVITDVAKAAIEKKGKEVTQKSVELQKVKQLAKNIRENNFTYEPTNEEEISNFEKAIEIAQGQVDAEAIIEEAEVKPRTKVKSK